jgi:hypothetical protein
VTKTLTVDEQLYMAQIRMGPPLTPFTTSSRELVNCVRDPITGALLHREVFKKLRWERYEGCLCRYRNEVRSYREALRGQTDEKRDRERRLRDLTQQIGSLARRGIGENPVEFAQVATRLAQETRVYNELLAQSASTRMALGMAEERLHNFLNQPLEDAA